MTQRDPQFGQLHDPAEVARFTGLEIADLDTDLPVETVTTGNAFAIVPVRSLAAIRELSVEWRRAAEYLKNTDAIFFDFVTRDTGSAARLHARMIFTVVRIPLRVLRPVPPPRGWSSTGSQSPANR